MSPIKEVHAGDPISLIVVCVRMAGCRLSISCLLKRLTHEAIRQVAERRDSAHQMLGSRRSCRGVESWPKGIFAITLFVEDLESFTEGSEPRNIFGPSDSVRGRCLRSLGVSGARWSTCSRRGGCGAKWHYHHSEGRCGFSPTTDSPRSRMSTLCARNWRSTGLCW